MAKKKIKAKKLDQPMTMFRIGQIYYDAYRRTDRRRAMNAMNGASPSGKRTLSKASEFMVPEWRDLDYDEKRCIQDGLEAVLEKLYDLEEFDMEERDD